MDNAFKRFFGGTDGPEGPDMVDENLHIEKTSKEEKRVNGKIIKISDNGWGFITSKEIKFTRIFFHWTSLKQDTIKFQNLKKGMKVEFTPVEIEGKGTRAIKIRVLLKEED